MKKIVIICLLLIAVIGCTSNGEPKIELSDQPIRINVFDDSFDNETLLEYLTFKNEKGQTVDPFHFEVIGVVDNQKLGQYPIKVVSTVNDKTIEIDTTVYVVDAVKPTISFNQKEILWLLGDEFIYNAMELGVSAYDNFDQDITQRVTIEGTVDVNTIGDSNLIFKVTDTSGNSVEETIKVRITKSVEEYIGYLHTRVIELYWGNMFVIENSENLKKVVNYDVAVNSILDNTYAVKFKSQIQNKTEWTYPISLDEKNNNYYITYNDYKKDVNYINSTFENVYKDSKYVEATVVSNFGANGITESTIRQYFSISKVNGVWKVKSFDLPY